MISIKKGLFIFCGCALISSGFAQTVREVNNAFPFNVLDMAENSPVSCRDLNKEIKNDSPHVVVDEKGHLSVGGERLRIFGTNLSAFPEKSQAERNAVSLADRGYNCIRFHHTDADWTNCFIKKDSTGKRVIDPVRLDTFDYFVFMLKKYGIYTNLNLLTGRTYTEKDGMPEGTDKISDWKNRHLLGFWNQKARDLQKEYAKALLEHINPYTGIALKDDPALCIVEINNEQGMLHSYFSNNFYDMPLNLWEELEVKWNKWLKINGFDYKTLSSRFNTISPLGETLIDNQTKFNLESHGGSKVSLTVNGNSKVLRILENGTEGWHVQLNTNKLKTDKNKKYTISFKAKASKKAKISVSLMMDHEPWSGLDWSKNIELDNQWQVFEWVVTGIKDDYNGRLNFGDMGFLSGTTIEFKDINMLEGGNIICVEKSSNGVRFPKSEEYWGLPKKYKSLVLNFLYDIETEYWTDMRDYVRNTLGCPALQMGSAMGNVTTGHSMLFDIVDSHAYFNHPVFPGSDWNQEDFYVKNKDLTKEEDLRTLTNLAGYRVFGKPFSVSEYDHPYPNQYSAEMYPMYAAFASYQDWDAIYTFCSDPIEKVNSRNKKITSYFDQTHNPVKTAAAPIAARIFRTGSIPLEKTYVWMNLNEEKERSKLQEFSGWNVGRTSVWGFEPGMTKGNMTGILWNGSSENLTGYEAGKKNTSQVQNPSNIFWDEQNGIFMATGENAFVYVGRKNTPLIKNLQNMNFEFIPSGDFTSVMGVRNAQGKWLFFAGSWSGNKGEQLRSYGTKNPAVSSKNIVYRGNVELTSKAPYQSGDALALSASGKLISLCGNWKISSLTEEGLTGSEMGTGSTFEFKEDSGSLWYLLEK